MIIFDDRFAMDTCISSMYIPGLECAFTNIKEGVALVQMNSPETNVTVVDMSWRTSSVGQSHIVFAMYMKEDTTDDEYTALFNTFNAPLQGMSGKTYNQFVTTKYFYTPDLENKYWGILFAAQSRKFTPFGLRQTHMVMFVVYVIEIADVSDVTEAVFGLLGIFLDADTKPARMC